MPLRSKYGLHRLAMFQACRADRFEVVMRAFCTTEATYESASLADQKSVSAWITRTRSKLAAGRYGPPRNGKGFLLGKAVHGIFVTNCNVSAGPTFPGYIEVPYYDPRVVFLAPRPGFFVGGGIRFGYG